MRKNISPFTEPNLIAAIKSLADPLGELTAVDSDTPVDTCANFDLPDIRIVVGMKNYETIKGFSGTGVPMFGQAVADILYVSPFGTHPIVVLANAAGGTAYAEGT